MTGPGERSVLYLAMLLGAAHIMSGICVIYVPSAGLVSAYSFLTDLVPDVLVGWILVFAGALAMIGGSIPFPLGYRLALIAPQEVILVLVAISISRAVIVGQYPDGYIPSGGSWFILADHNVAWIVSVMQVIEASRLAISRSTGD